MFAYPKRLEEKKEEKKELVATAILSTTAKAKARLAKQEAKGFAFKYPIPSLLLAVCITSLQYPAQKGPSLSH